ncbi:MAG: TonB family protein [Candidatus Binatus sp.]|jgi:TonB family protein|uniref:TonB family protein n=1 Tax=Candidatus Binatus sp. TaxID=2811406 RepID=UPI003D14AA1F
MKRCPRCEKTFPDSETFCEADGTALVQAGPAFAEGAAATGAIAGGEQIECPVCGGKAQPGELICNFCGARLGVESATPYARQPSSSPPRVTPGGAAVRRDASPSMRITGRMPDGESEEEGRGRFGTVWYVIAAIVALGGGAWLALHLSTTPAEQPVANASPAAVASVTAPAPSGPLVALSKAMGVQVTGESAAAPERNQEAARKFFEDHKDGLLESYSRAIAGDSTLRDGMAVRVRVLPNGSVDEASVRTSTNANPAFDAEVVKDVSAWNFAPFSGGPVEIDYPVIFTNDPATKDALESQLSSKVAGLSPTEAPEFASAPAAPSPAASEAVSAPSPAGVESPPMVAEPAPTAAPAPRKRHHVATAPKPPPLTLQQQVKLVLGSNPRTRRVDCYTSGSTVTVFGKVFDADAKLYTEKIVRQVPGVGNVIDSLSTDTADWASRQAAIASQIYAAGLNNVTVKVIGHDAYLGGTVKSDAQKQQAVTITENASPGVHVRGNIITVVPGNMFGF